MKEPIDGVVKGFAPVVVMAAICALMWATLFGEHGIAQAQERGHPAIVGDKLPETMIWWRIADLNGGILCQQHQWQIDRTGICNQFFVDKDGRLNLRLDTHVSLFSEHDSTTVLIDVNRSYASVLLSALGDVRFYRQDVPPAECIPVKIEYDKK